MLSLRSTISTMSLLLALVYILISSSPAIASEFDHSHQQWTKLLQQNVVLSADKKQSRVDYQRLYDHSENLASYLSALSGVNKAQYDNWNADQQLSFLINAYNAFTLKLINDNWPEFENGDAQSIRDLGSLFTNPWQNAFFQLLEKQHSLDDVEHEMIRKWFEQPRIHAALVCAAVSCPPLRNEAFVAEKLASQLDSQMLVFLSDNNRNEIVFDNGKAIAELSSIFKWYGEDFEKGHDSFNSLNDVLVRYQDALVDGDSNKQAQLAAIESGSFTIRFKDYDWKLNHVSSF